MMIKKSPATKLIKILYLLTIIILLTTLFLPHLKPALVARAATTVKLVWIDGENGARKIYKADIDGSNRVEVVTSNIDTPEYGIDVDATNGKIYWTDTSFFGGSDAIWWADLNGTDSNVASIISGVGYIDPSGIAVDPAGGKIYYGYFSSTGLFRADLDGSNAAQIVVSSYVGAVALDLTNSKVYWTEPAPASGNDLIKRADLDGSNSETFIDLGGDTDPYGLEIDPAGGYVYWSNFFSNNIERAPITGGSKETLFDSGTDGIDAPYDVDLDVAAGKIYWIGGDQTVIKSGNMDGSGSPASVANTNTGNPRALAIYTSVTPDTPTLTGFSPSTNAITATLSSNVVLTYSAEISSASVTSRTVAVHGMMGGMVTGAPSVNGNVVTVNPATDFFPGEVVFASATDQTADITGTHPLTPTVWQFTTAAGVGPVNFPVSNPIGAVSDPTNSVAFGDVDRDGDLDVVMGNYVRQNVVYLNEGNGTFPISNTVGPGDDWTRYVALGDVNGDGYLDIAVGNDNNKANVVYLNNGDGTFPGSGNSFGANARGLALGDADGDGDLDIAIGADGTDGPDAIYLNDGSGVFTLGSTLATGASSKRTFSVAWGDMDRDGDLDLVASNFGGQDLVYLNNGDGTFPITQTVGPGTDQTQNVALGDVNNDGHLDIAVATTAGSTVYLNNGDGSFPAGGTSIATAMASRIALGDMNGDGYLDAVTTNNPFSYLYLNQGNGTFGSSKTYGEIGSVLALGDADNDGDMDIALGLGNSSLQSWVHLNNPPPADLTIVKTASPGSAQSGAAITYTLTFSNAGGDTATGVVITDRVPVSITNVSVISSGVAITDTGATPAYVWQVADLAPNAGGVITLTGILNSGTQQPEVFTNTATITTTALELITNNNSSAASLTRCSPAITVTTTADSGAGTLRQAVADICPGGVIDFDLTTPATITLTSDELTIDRALTINGPGRDNLTVSGDGNYRIFAVDAATTDAITIAGLTLREGDVSDGGGAIANNASGSFVISGTRFISNTAGAGGAIYNSPDGNGLALYGLEFSGNSAFYGGAIFNENSDDLIVATVVFTNNSALGDYGGFYAGGDVFISDSLFQGNTAQADVAGAFYTDGAATITNTKFIGNTAAGDYGAVYVEDDAVISGSLFRQNHAKGGWVGALDVEGTLTMTDTQFISNTASTEDGAVYVLGDATIFNSLFQGNSAGGYAGAMEVGGSLVISGTQFISNTTNDDDGAFYTDGSVTITNTDFISNTANGYNGAFYAVGNVSVSDSEFRGNVAQNNNNGVFYTDGSVTITNTDFISNTAGFYNGAFYAVGDVTISDNSLFQGNVAQNNNNGVFWSDSAVTIDDSQFENNRAESGWSGVFGATGDITVRHSQLVDNYADGGSGAFYGGSDLYLFDSHVQGNYGGENSAIWVDGSSTITNTQIISNTAGSGSGALYLTGGGTLDRVVLQANRVGSGGYGAAIYSEGGLDVVNSLLANNGVDGGGSVINFNAAGATLALTHTTIASATLGSGSAIEVATGGTLGITNSIIANYTTGISTTGGTVNEDYNLFAGVSTPVNGGSAGTHSWVSSDFSDAGFGNAAGGVFTVTSSSWAINKGADAGITTDYFGDDRPGGGGYDLGYDETTFTGPTAADDTAVTTINLAVTISPLSNDTETDGDALTIGAVGSAAHGDVTVISNSTQLVFTPTTGYSGTVVFTYTAREASQLEDTATITVTVMPPPDVAISKTVSPVSAKPGETITYTLTFSNAGGVTATGVVISDSVPVSVTNVSVISSGVTITATGSAPNFVWAVEDLAPDAGGVITLTGTLTEPLAVGHQFTNTAVITAAGDSHAANNSDAAGLTVQNAAPIAVDDTALVMRRNDSGDLILLGTTPVTIPVLVNDTDPNSGNNLGLTIIAVGSGSQGGTAVPNINGRLIDYTPATTAFTGTETFTYTASDSGGLKDTATVTVTVVNGDGGGSTKPGDSSGETIVIPETGINGTITVTVQIPAGVATDTFALVYNEIVSPTQTVPQGFVLAGLSFTLEAYVNQVLQAGYVFSTPITLTVEYGDTDMANVPGGENSLELRYWDGSNWSSDGIIVIERDTANNRLVVSIAHLTEFALLGKDVTRNYLPLIVKDYTAAPDLVITSLVANGGQITVTVKNQGNTAVLDAFWLDVYFNPSQTPALNQPWPDISPAGAVWGVETNIPVGDSLTLTVGDGWYYPALSSASFPANAQVYGYVDSIGYTTGYGNVFELDESNNLSAPQKSGNGGAAAGDLGGQSDDATPASLPSR